MKKVFAIYCAMIAIASCAQSPNKSSSPQHYDLNSPVKYDMPQKLLEISGIAFNKGDNSTMYAEQDESGMLFYFKPGDKQIRSTTFGGAGDYEDVAVSRNYIIILRSDGTLFTFPVNGINNSTAQQVKTWEDLLPKGEYESLYADEASGRLYLICKTCKQDKETSSGYILQLSNDGSIAASGNFTVSVAAAEKGKKKKKNNFHPSALAKNPVTGEWYILSSVNKMLVIADSSWNVTNTYPLNPGKFLQPEGLAFDKQGNIYISNEGDKIQNGNVLLFKYK